MIDSTTTTPAMMPIGRSKGLPLSSTQISEEDLIWAIGRLTADIADPAKARYRDRNVAARLALDDERMRRRCR